MVRFITIANLTINVVYKNISVLFTL